MEGKIRIENNRIKVPILGWLKLSEKIDPLKGIKNIRISRQASHWFVSFKVPLPKIKYNIPTNTPVGVDLGIKDLATLSNGMVFPNLSSLAL